MDSKSKRPHNQNKPHAFTAALPDFDKAVRKIAKVSKAELERREQVERDAKQASR